MTKSKALFFISAAAIGLSAIYSAGCSKTAASSIDSSSNAVEASMAEVGAQASAGEGSVGFLPKTRVSIMGDAFAPEAVKRTTCTYSVSCSGNVGTVNFNSCTLLAGEATLTGGWTDTFSGGNGSCEVPLASGESLTRTSSGAELTFSNLPGLLALLDGAYITSDTNGGTAWDGTVIPSSGATVANTAGTVTVDIAGTHRTMKTSGGDSIFDYFVTTPSAITVAGSLASHDRTITTGTVKVYHNLAKYDGVMTYNNVVWGNSACCFPTSGNISAVFSGSKTGTATMTFTSSCGTANYVDENGNSKTLSLSQCN